MLEAMAYEPTGGAPGAAPGWYQDPHGSGGQRYWDGAQWTEHVSPPPGQAAGSAPGAHGLQAQAAAGLPDSNARQWGMLAHLSGLAAWMIGLPMVGPLVVYLAKKDEHPFIADQAREALNFNLSWFIYMLVLGLVTFVLIFLIVGFLLIPVIVALAIGWIVLSVIAAIKANNGEAYRYPLTIRMIS